MSSVTIGIDLGTTHTVAAIYRNGTPEIITNTDGRRLTPSIVYYQPEDLKALVGKIAENQSLKCPRNFMFDIKRIIGRTFSDAYVQHYVTMGKKNTFSLQISSDENGAPCILLDSDISDYTAYVSPEQVSTDILKYIKESTETFLKCDVTEAVISVPAYFSYAQRAATKRAAENAGFTVLKLITEPVAAAIFYTYGKFEEDKQLLMVDVGGGTLDVSIIKCTKDNFEVKSIEGDMFLGGRDFDEHIFDYLRQEIGKKYSEAFVDPSTKKGIRFFKRLRHMAVKYKHGLSRMDKFSAVIEGGNDNVFEIELTRNKFEELSEPLFQRIINKVERCLSAAKISASNIDKVVLAGGSTRIPKLRQLLKNMFDGNEPCTDLNPDEAVALGASIHAALLTNNLADLEKYQLKDVAPHSLGILTRYDLIVPFIEKGTALPAASNQFMETGFNCQDFVIFKIYEGERKRGKHNKNIGHLTISDLPQERAGKLKFEVSFVLDEDGLLCVEAVENISGHNNQLAVKMNELKLCDSDIFLSPEQEKKISEEDAMWEEFYRFLIITDQYCNNVIYDVGKQSLIAKRDVLMKHLNTFTEKQKELNFRNIDILKDEFEELKRNIQSALCEN